MMCDVHHTTSMIRSFKNRATERLFNGERVKQWEQVQSAARILLTALHAATSLNDLVRTPGIQLKALKGKRQGQHSIRINKQWRICFVWRQSTQEAHDVEITDYH